MNKVILHCDMNSFYASVELLEHPDLVHEPVAVCGNPKNRHGIILAKNEVAKKYKIATGETLWQAKKKCPNLKTLKPHMYKYKEMSKSINLIFERYTDLLEPFSIDESWLDVTNSISLFSQDNEIKEILTGRKEFKLIKKLNLKEPLLFEEKLIVGTAIADHIRKTVYSELGLTLSIGVSYNKVFAKMGSEYKKPNATTLISPSNFKGILWTLPVNELFFVGRKTAENLNKIGITKIGELAKLELSFLEKNFGKAGAQLYEYANGLDNSPVSHLLEKRKIGTIGNGMTFTRNLLGEEDIKMALLGLSDQVCARLRKQQLKALGVKVDIKNPSFITIARQKQLTNSSNSQEDIYQAAFQLILTNWDLSKPIRLITLTAINLIDENTNEQLSFWDEDNEKKEKKESVNKTLDSIRTKFGDTALTFGSLINNDIGISGKHHIDKDED